MVVVAAEQQEEKMLEIARFRRRCRSFFTVLSRECVRQRWLENYTKRKD